MFKRYTQTDAVAPLDDAMFTDPLVPMRSCCCPARPAVKVIMPPTAGRRHSVDLWLCGHHYRESLAALLAARAAIENLAGPADPRTERATARA
ncbi:MAG TPA: hypothetical protein VFO01_17250 [Trebonia sp.]|nr:hypothetical protein [Trebonia sp.]